MYIRRKVFSTYIDENGEEKLFSTTEIMSEESYLEKLYSENELEQREFGKFDLQLAKKAYPKYAKYVGENPAYMKRNLRFWRAKGIEEAATKEGINSKLLEKEIKLNKKRNKQLVDMGKKPNRAATYLDIV